MAVLIRMQTGIGQFAIADDAAVTEADLGVNFFLEESNLGKPRAQCCTELLLELNPEVQGKSYTGTEASWYLRCSDRRANQLAESQRRRASLVRRCGVHCNHVRVAAP